MNRLRLLPLVALTTILMFWVGCGSDTPPEEAAAPEPAETAKVEEPPAAEPPAAAPEPEPEPAPAPAPKVAPKPKPKAPSLPIVALETSKGTIKLELYPDKAPKTVENFLAYVDSGFYSGTVFHRVIPTFMIQGGGMTPELEKKATRDPITNEAQNGLKNDRGTIAMARTFMPHSATAQFFINHKDNAMLNNSPQNGWGYAVFGKVVEGMDVVDAIAAAETTTKTAPAADGEPAMPMSDVPKETILIKSAKRVS